MTALNDRVMAYCKVCKAVTDHSVAEVKGRIKKTPKRVACVACRDTHPFRASAPGSRKKATPDLPLHLSYDRLMEGRDLSKTTRYEMSRQFDARDLIAHDSFGVGLVVRVLADRKIEVRFPMGTKMLVHDRSDARSANFPRAER
jgi:hypothetical protein